MRRSWAPAPRGRPRRSRRTSGPSARREHPGDPWEKWVIDETLTVIHGLYVGDLDGDGRAAILTASFEGIHRFDWKQGALAEGPHRARCAAGEQAGGGPRQQRSGARAVGAEADAPGGRGAVARPSTGGLLARRATGASGNGRCSMSRSRRGTPCWPPTSTATARTRSSSAGAAARGGIRLFHLNSDGVSWRGVGHRAGHRGRGGLRGGHQR